MDGSLRWNRLSFGPGEFQLHSPQLLLPGACLGRSQPSSMFPLLLLTHTLTSSTFFLLDLSLGAQAREAPLSSTVYSGMESLEDCLCGRGEKGRGKLGYQEPSAQTGLPQLPGSNTPGSFGSRMGSQPGGREPEGSWNPEILVLLTT